MALYLLLVAMNVYLNIFFNNAKSYSYSCSLSWREDSSTECLPSKLVFDVKKLKYIQILKLGILVFSRQSLNRNICCENKAKEFKKSLLVRRTS